MPPDAPRLPAKDLARVAGAGLILLLAVFGALLWRPGPPAVPGPVGAVGAGRVGAATCRACHPEIPPAHLRASRPGAEADCEDCHGPGTAHAEGANRIAAGLSENRDRRLLELPFARRREPAEDEFRMCARCHAGPANAPGPVALLESACYLRSRGGLRCSTCHDPHAPTSRTAADYEAACLQCHTKPEIPSKARIVECPSSPRTGCIPCHMPERDTSRGLMFSDHSIRTRPDGER